MCIRIPQINGIENALLTILNNLSISKSIFNEFSKYLIQTGLKLLLHRYEFYYVNFVFSLFPVFNTDFFFDRPVVCITHLGPVQAPGMNRNRIKE